MKECVCVRKLTNHGVCEKAGGGRAYRGGGKGGGGAGEPDTEPKARTLHKDVGNKRPGALQRCWP